MGCGRGLSQKKKKKMTTIEMADGKSLRIGSMIVNDWDGNDGEWKGRERTRIRKKIPGPVKIQ